MSGSDAQKQQGRADLDARIPECRNGHTTYDERIEELGRRSS
jgi:hypothetical protein